MGTWGTVFLILQRDCPGTGSIREENGQMDLPDDCAVICRSLKNNRFFPVTRTKYTDFLCRVVRALLKITLISLRE